MDEAHLIRFDDQEFVRFEPGQFVMGAIQNDITSSFDLESRHTVNITKAFYLQTTPVTTRQYFSFISETGYDHNYNIEIWDGNDWVDGPNFADINSRGDDYPIVGVSYTDAENYIRWTASKRKVSFRLPTEAEYEYAAKDNCKCVSECYYATIAHKRGLTRPEGQAPDIGPRKVRCGIKTCSGLYDMHGLIWQWCSDWFFYYNLSDAFDPIGPVTEPKFAPWRGEKWAPGKVIRGGSFSYPYYFSRCSNRHYSLITDRNYNLGFRLCFNLDRG